jgi:molybdopterin converting factor subunit 1
MGVPSAATTIAVKVLVFAQLKDRFGADELHVVLPYGSTGRDLMRWFAQRNPKAEALLEVSRLAVNSEYASLDHALQDGDEAVVIPPVSGG